ncbi:MAG TPA: arginase family protein [Opitutaceae bacterium]
MTARPESPATTPVHPVLAIIEAPSPLGLRPPAPSRVPGVRFMPQVLRAAGLWTHVPRALFASLPEPDYQPEVDPSTGVRNLPELERFTRDLSRVVSAALEANSRPIVIGGDCSVLLGAALALARRGRHRLVHVDGHSDFAHEGNMGRLYPNVAGAALAIVTGRGPAALTSIDGRGPYFRDDDVLQLGAKAEPGTPDWLEDFARTTIERVPSAWVNAHGAVAALERVARWLARGPAGKFWLHVDVDVLAPALLPAVDSPDEGGIDWAAFETILGGLVSRPEFIGANIGIYDPELDPDRRYARQLVEVLARVLGLGTRGAGPGPYGTSLWPSGHDLPDSANGATS